MIRHVVVTQMFIGDIRKLPFFEGTAFQRIEVYESLWWIDGSRTYLSLSFTHRASRPSLESETEYAISEPGSSSGRVTFGSSYHDLFFLVMVCAWSRFRSQRRPVLLGSEDT